MIESHYVLLSVDNLKKFPIKESLGHKILGVEPDIIIDLSLKRPRLIVRSELYKPEGEFIEEIGAGYCSKLNRNVFLGFSYLKPKVAVDCSDENLNNILKDMFYKNVPVVSVSDNVYQILVHPALLKILSQPQFKDVEYRRL